MASQSHVIRHGCASGAPRSRCVISTVDPATSPGVVVTCHRVQVEKGEAIFHGGSPALGWVILCEGTAKRIVRTDGGKNVILGFCGSGELLGGLVSGTYPYSAVAVTRCVVTFIPGQDVASLARRHPEVLIAANRRWAEEQCRLARRLADLAYGSVRARLARILLELCEEYGMPERVGVRIDLPLSLRDLAEMIGAARPTTSAELQALVRRGLIKLAWPTIVLLDPDGLRRYR